MRFGKWRKRGGDCITKRTFLCVYLAVVLVVYERDVVCRGAQLRTPLLLAPVGGGPAGG